MLAGCSEGTLATHLGIELLSNLFAMSGVPVGVQPDRQDESANQKSSSETDVVVLSKCILPQTWPIIVTIKHNLTDHDDDLDWLGSHW